MPSLKPSRRKREYELYDEPARDVVIYTFLFEGKGYREIDTDVLHFNQENSEGWKADTKGWQSRGILSYLGLNRQHKGLFAGWDVWAVINELPLDGGWLTIRQSLVRYASVYR